MISKAWYVQCDRCLDPAPVSTNSRTEARLYARSEAGYIYKYNRDDKKHEDICPRCKGIKVTPIW